jgi:hypothetical protein
VEVCDDWQTKTPQQSEDMAAGRAAVDAEFMLKAHDFCVGEIEEISGPPITAQVLLSDLETDFGRVGVSFRYVIHSDYKTIYFGFLERPAYVACKRRNATLTWHVITDQRNLIDLVPNHILLGK